MPIFERSEQVRGLPLRLLAAGVLTAAAAAAFAGAASTSFMVSATVESACAVSANPLSFGSYRPGQGSALANTTLAVRCARGTPFTVALDAGSGGSSVARRLMTFGSYRLEYNLYTTPARTTVWGDGTQSSATVSGTGHGLSIGQAIVQTVYGQVPDIVGNQDLAPGLYTDTIRVTVSY
jgi:spore coat protein U-like protein